MPVGASRAWRKFKRYEAWEAQLKKLNKTQLLEELDAMDLKASIHRRWRRPFLLGKMAQAEKTQGTNTLVVALKGGCCGGKPDEPSVEPPYKLTEVPSTKFRRRPLINPEPVDCWNFFGTSSNE